MSVMFKKAFLPNGYPYTVSRDYLEYQLWDSIQAFASSIMNNLATHAVFKGVGVGDANATVLAATITWLLKDGTSIIGSLIFATIQCTKMDSDCKRWRLFADILNDVAICIDLVSPLFIRSFFVIVQCFSGILRSLVGIAGGATRAALTQHQAKCNNMADVSAKDNSQERIVNLFALLFSLILIPMIADRTSVVWTLIILLIFIHVYANYRAVKSVSIEVFNVNRLLIFIENYIQLRTNKHFCMEESLSVDSVNKMENIWFFKSSNLYRNIISEHNVNITFVSADELVNRYNYFIKQHHKDEIFFDNEKRFIIYTTDSNATIINCKFDIFIGRDLNEKNQEKPEIFVLNDSDTSLIIIEILFLIYIVGRSRMKTTGQLESNDFQIHDSKHSTMLKNAADKVKNCWHDFVIKMNAHKWDISHLLVFELFTLTDQIEEKAANKIDLSYSNIDHNPIETKKNI